MVLKTTSLEEKENCEEKITKGEKMIENDPKISDEHFLKIVEATVSELIASLKEDFKNANKELTPGNIKAFTERIRESIEKYYREFYKRH